MGLTGVVDLELPEAAYTTGKSPSHARVENLHDCYRNVGRGDVLALLSAGGMLRERVNGGRVQRMIPTQDAVDAGLVFRCSGVALWGVDAVAAWARAVCAPTPLSRMPCAVAWWRFARLGGCPCAAVLRRDW